MGSKIETAPWTQAFEVSGGDGDIIPLGQLDAKHFALGAVTISYRGQTGLERFAARGERGLSPESLESIRSVDQTKLPTTDLASVPFMMRWFTNTYGEYTPAVLIHDWLIVNPDEDRLIRPEFADRYFRYMLDSVGVAPIKRYLMWAGVALRTRSMQRGLLRSLMVWLWVVLATAGIAAFVVAAIASLADTGPPFGIDVLWLWAASLAGPFVASLLWGRQYAAGLVASAAALWLLVPVLLVTVGYGFYFICELVASRLIR
jgi:hypothetical protein